MSSISKGASRVGSVMSQLAAAGYRTARISASGQRKGSRKKERCIGGDLLAFAPTASQLPHLICEVGGPGKVITGAINGLVISGLPPGFRACVVRCIRRRWRWSLDRDSSYRSLAELLKALREGA